LRQGLKFQVLDFTGNLQEGDGIRANRFWAEFRFENSDAGSVN
jgi:hypothetical protein